MENFLTVKKNANQVNSFMTELFENYKPSTCTWEELDMIVYCISECLISSVAMESDLFVS